MNLPYAKPLEEEEKKELLNPQVLSPIEAHKESTQFDNPFDGTECATSEEITYFTQTVPKLKN